MSISGFTAGAGGDEDDYDQLVANAIAELNQPPPPPPVPPMPVPEPVGDMGFTEVDGGPVYSEPAYVEPVPEGGMGFTEFDGGQAFAEPAPPEPEPIDYGALLEPGYDPIETTFTSDEEYFAPMQEELFGSPSNEGLVDEITRLESQLYGDPESGLPGMQDTLAQIQERVDRTFAAAENATSDEEFNRQRDAYNAAVEEYNRTLERAQGVEAQLSEAHEQAGPLWERYQLANSPFGPGEGGMQRTTLPDGTNALLFPEAGTIGTPEYRLIPDQFATPAEPGYIPQYRSDIQDVIDRENARVTADVQRAFDQQELDNETRRLMAEATGRLGFDPQQASLMRSDPGFDEFLQTGSNIVRDDEGNIIYSAPVGGMAGQLEAATFYDLPGDIAPRTIGGASDLLANMWEDTPTPGQWLVGGPAKAAWWTLNFSSNAYPQVSGAISAAPEIGRTGLQFAENVFTKPLGRPNTQQGGIIGDLGNPNLLNQEDVKQIPVDWQAGVETYNNLPLAVRIGIEMAGDPTNAAPGIGFVKLGVGSVIKHTVLNRGSLRFVEKAIMSGKAVDHAYVDAVVQLDREGISFIDSLKITSGANDFSNVLSRYATTPAKKDALEEFAVRTSTRLHAEPITKWSAIRDEELERLADNGLTLNDSQIANLNERLTKARDALSKGGNDYWSTIYADVPTAQKTFSKAERARIVDLPEVGTISSVQDVTPVTVASFEKADIPFSRLFPSRWQQFYLSESATNGARPGVVIASFIPEVGDADEVAYNYFKQHEVTDGIRNTLETIYKKDGLDYVPPTNLADAKTMIDNARPPRYDLPPGPTIADTLNNPAYRTMDLTTGMQTRVSPAQLWEIERRSRLHGENLLTKLGTDSAEFRAFSHGRFNEIIDAVLATPEQQRLIRKAVTDKQLDVDLGSLPQLTERKAEELLESLFPPKKGDELQRNIQNRIRATRTADPMVTVNLARQEQFNTEMAVVLDDMLIGTGKESLWVGGTRYQKAAGRLRMGQEQIVKLFMKAPQWLTNDPYYGSIIEQVRQFVQSSAPNAGQVVLDDAARGVVDDYMRALVEVVESAPTDATGQFFKWLDNAYDNTKLVKSGMLRKKKFELVNNPVQSAEHYLQLASEVQLREALLARVQERLERFSALGQAMSWTDAKGKLHSFDFLSLRSANAKEQFDAFLKAHPYMDAAQARKAARQYLMVGNVNLSNIVKEIGELKGVQQSLGREIRDGRGNLLEHAEEFGYADVAQAQDFTVTNRVADFAKEFNLTYHKAGANISDPQIASEVSTADVIHSFWKQGDSGIPTPDPLLKPVTKAEIGQAERTLYTSGLWNDVASLGRIDDLVALNEQFAAPVMDTISGGAFEFRDEASQALFTIAHYSGQGAQGRQALESYWKVLSGHSLGIAQKGRQEVVNEAVRLKNMAQVISRVTGEQTVPVAAGKVVLNGREMRDKVLAYLVEQQRTQLTGPGSRAAQGVLDMLAMQLRSGTEEASRWANLENVDLSPYLMPNHTRPDITIIDPAISSLARVDWNPANGRVFDNIVTQMYQPAEALGDARFGNFMDWASVKKQQAQIGKGKGDPIWGHTPGDRLSNLKHISDLHDMSKGILMGDLTESVVHKAFSMAAHPELVPLRPGVPVVKGLVDGKGDPYALMVHVLDGIAADDPLVMQHFGDMFRTSQDMDRWLTWFRLKDEGGQATWDNLRRNWGQYQPHDSVAGLPRPMLSHFAKADTKTGMPYFNEGGLKRLDEAMRMSDGQFPSFMMTPARDAARQAGDKKASEALRAAGEATQARLTNEMVEFDNFRAAFRDRWVTGSDALRDPLSLKFRSGIHHQDVDHVLLPDALDKPYAVALLGKRLGAGATEFEHARLGFDLSSVNPLLRLQYATKRFFGTFWLRSVPRFVVNNFGGALMSVLAHTLRQGTSLNPVTAVTSIGGSLDALTRAGSGLTGPRMLHQGMAQTEATLRFLTERQIPKPIISSKVPGKAIVPAPIKSAIGHSKRPLDFWLSKIAAGNDWADIGGRRLIYSGELEGRYGTEWGRKVSQQLVNLKPGDEVFQRDLLNAFGIDQVMDVAKRHELSQEATVQVVRAQNEALEIARWSADKLAREAMRDYSMRTNSDYILDHIFPYHFWTTKNLLFSAKVVKEAPVAALHASTLFDAAFMGDDSPYQQHKMVLNKLTNPLREMMGNVPVLGDAGIGDFLLGDPDDAVAMRFSNWTNPAIFQAATVLEDMRQAYDRYDNMSMQERTLKMLSAGFSSFWEESGFRPGIQYSFPVEVGNRDDFKKWVDKQAGSDWYSEVMGGYISPVMNPKDFRTEALPLGGIEQGLKLFPFVGDDYEQMLTWLNTQVHGTPYSNLDHVNIGRHLVAMAAAGDFGELNEDGTLTPETEARFRSAMESFGSKRYDNEDLQVAIDRMEHDKAIKGTRSIAGVPVSTTEAFIGDMYDLNQQFWQLKANEDAIPLPNNIKRITPPGFTHAKLAVPTGSQVEDVAWIRATNGKLAELATERDRRKELANYDPDETLKWQEWYEGERQKLYDQAKDKGIYVPQLNGNAPRYAEEWAFGKWNPATGQREGGQANVLGIWWLINKDEESLDTYFLNADVRAEKNYQWNLHRENVAQNRDRNATRTPYFEQIDGLRSDFDTSAAKIRSKDIPEASKMFLLDNLDRSTQANIRAIYDRAEDAGVDLRGAGKLPYHTARWYQMREQRGTSQELEEVLSLGAKNDTIAAQTGWMMEEVLTALDLWKYDEQGVINPKYAKRLDDGRIIFDSDRYDTDLKQAAQQAPALYRDLLQSYESPIEGDPGLQIYAKGMITSSEFMEHVNRNVIPDLDAWNEEINTAYADVASETNSDEKAAKITRYRDQFGPGFYAISSRPHIDPNEIAGVVQSEFDLMTPEQQKSFIELYPELVSGSGVIRPEQLDGETVTDIATRYNITFPTDQQAQDEENAQDIVSNVYYASLSGNQKEEWRELYGQNYPGLFTEISKRDEETGEIYQTWRIHPEMLKPNELAELMADNGLRLGEERGDIDTLGAGGEDITPKHMELLARAQEDKQIEHKTDQFFDGSLYLEGDALSEWQEFRSFTEAHPQEEDAVQQIKKETGATWKEMADYFEDGSSLDAYIQARQTLSDENNMNEHYNARSAYLLGEEGQELLLANPDVIKYAPDAGDGSGSGGSGYQSGGKSSGGYSKSGGGSSYRSGGSSGGGYSGRSALPLGDYSGIAREVFSWDPVVRSGDGDDAVARRDIAMKLADFFTLWEEKATLLKSLFGDRDGGKMFTLVSSLMARAIKNMLGEEPTLEGWQKVLAFLISKGFVEPAVEGEPALSGQAGTAEVNVPESPQPQAEGAVALDETEVVPQDVAAD